ncbi:hypothetical protein [Halomonas salinarum]|uniref:hypothetical protein n=1 Tax=Halomonas salinarum TaxID=1158993 RepID=UPI00143AC6E1|nr:hypothetical protein [Halomonas salinarum]
MNWKGKQSVSYRTMDDDLLRFIIGMPKGAGNLLVELLQSVDKNDNCLQVSLSSIIKENGWDQGNTSRHLSKLKREGVVKDVFDIHGVKRLMINPALVWSTRRDKLRFAVLMYETGSHEKAVEHKRFEDSLVAHIDPKTGEITGNYQDREESLIKALAAAIGSGCEEPA